MPATRNADFTSSLGCLIDPSLADLAAQLGAIPNLTVGEADAIRHATAEVVYETVHRKCTRLLVLELNAARVTHVLRAETPEQRWDEFLDLSSRRAFWESLTKHYPSLIKRLSTLIENRCASALAMARRLAADRRALEGLLPGEAGELVEVSFGAGDSHCGGHSVALLRFDSGKLVYKPRSLDVDSVLATVLAEVLADDAVATRIRVAKVLVRAGYGWAEHVSHRYCTDSVELSTFYRNIGQWLGLMRLLGGSDLHAENLIACGPVPVVVDCETLFTPLPPAPHSGLGLAVDRAREMVEGTVLRTGLLPSRGVSLGWRGVDGSAVGSLPGQQPLLEHPTIEQAGTDQARVGLARVEVAPIVKNHPTPNPDLGQNWEQVLSGFREMTDRLLKLDREGTLAPLLARFADCPVRVVTRGTETYAEVGRMLWHPVSLHDEGRAIGRARQLLAKSAESMPLAPADLTVIEAEIAELLDGDIPYFATTPRVGRLDGPRGTAWLPQVDLIADALRRWRAADFDFERQVIQATLVSAYLNEGWVPSERSLRPTSLQRNDLEGLRRRLARSVLQQMTEAAYRGEDDTVTWVAPVLNATGWMVQPLGQDLYGGLPGVAVLISAYLREVAAGRADEVRKLDVLLDGVLRTIRAAENWEQAHRRPGLTLRPPVPGGYIGLGSQIWAWLTLEQLGATCDAVERARARATFVPPAVEADENIDVLTGVAGLIVPLLHLAKRTGEERWVDYATLAGERLIGQATVSRHGAYWSTARWPEGLGGFAHGATGIGWALSRLFLVTGDDRFAAMAEAAFEFEESLYDERAGGWRDLREPGQTAAAWCHGSVGIGLAAADLSARGSSLELEERWRDVVRRAAAATWATGMGWNHTPCHGDLGCWELLETALAMGLHPTELDKGHLLSHILSSLDECGPISGFARDAFAPGLVAGLGGVAYQLLRMNSESRLPSVLILSEVPS